MNVMSEKNPEDIISRVRLLIELSGLSVNSYAHKIGVYPQTLYKCVGGRVPAVELLQGILAAYPTVSAEWLLMGEGDMEKKDLILLKRQLEIKDEQIKNLIEKIR